MSDSNEPKLMRNLRRRDFVRVAGAMGWFAGAQSLLPRYAWGAERSIASSIPRTAGRSRAPVLHELTIGETSFGVAGRQAKAVTINGTVPGPLLRLREGDDVLLRVKNRLREQTSIHWHGLLVPPSMDGVPGLSFRGIDPGETFDYQFQIKQYGTYWYHSHSGLQEQLGHYGPIIIEPKNAYPYKFDREYVIVLSDWTFENPYKVLDRLKKQSNYYNMQRRTMGDLLSDIRRDGFGPTLRDRLMWTGMRMDPTDLLDINGSTYTYLMNGRSPESNWTGQFQRGERVLLRVINASAATYFDFRIPGLPMTVVQASGQLVEPVETDEFRIANAETFDVIVEPDGQPYTIFAESMDRSGYASGTLTPRDGATAPIPARRKRALLTMTDMGMNHGAAADGMPGMPGMDHSKMPGMAAMPGMDHSKMPGMDAMPAAVGRAPGTLPVMLEHGPGTHGTDNAMVPMMLGSRLAEAGVGLGSDGWRVLRYSDLRSLAAHENFQAPTREIELHLTGNMERFMWSFDGVPFDKASPIRMNHGERIRLTLVNDTMMNHPMHLHGMWMELENGHGDHIPRVHTVNVKPAERLSLLITADKPGRWAFHCHILYHMAVGMFRIVEVAEAGKPFVIEGSPDAR